MTIVVNALLPVFLAIALGAVLKRTLLPSEQAWNGIERLTYFVLFPVLLMVTTGTANISGIPAREMTIALVVPFLLVIAILMLHEHAPRSRLRSVRAVIHFGFSDGNPME